MQLISFHGMEPLEHQTIESAQRDFAKDPEAALHTCQRSAYTATFKKLS